MMADSLAGLTVQELRVRARELGVTGYSRLRKRELIAACQAAMTGAPIKASAASPREAATVAVEPLPTSVVAAPTPPPAPAPPPVSETPFAFPPSYGVDRAVLLVRDPHWLYAYWDTSAQTWAMVQESGLADPTRGWRRILRLHDVSQTTPDQLGAHTHLFDIDLDEAARDFYFQAPAADRYYLVEYGYLSSNGEFVRLAVSNVTDVPRNAPSDQLDESWGQLYDEALRLSLAGAGAARGVPGQPGSATLPGASEIMAGEQEVPGSADLVRHMSSGTASSHLAQTLHDALGDRRSSGPFSADSPRHRPAS